MKLSESLKKLRREHHLTQEALAKQLNVSKSTISMYENGERIPPSDMIERIADLFHVSINMLYGREDTAKTDEEEIKVALFGGDGEVTDEMWDEVKQYAEYIKAKYKK